MSTVSSTQNRKDVPRTESGKNLLDVNRRVSGELDPLITSPAGEAARLPFFNKAYTPQDQRSECRSCRAPRSTRCSEVAR